MIPITKPFLPPKEEYQKLVEGIWDRNWLTNNGPLVNELEHKLKEYLGVSHILYTSNGTIALQLAIKALGLKGEIITTPFSYVATTSSIVWEGCKPKFVDIDANTLNIDPSKIEAAITENTSAILATHVYGNPCDVDAIQKIAENHNLKVIYDAAHCFGTTYKGKSIFEYGDVSATSFHATKVFPTIEGGAVFTKNSKLLKKMAYMRNFGHDGPGQFAEVGINGKNSEFHAAMGLVNLRYIDDILKRRKILSKYYDQKLAKVNMQRPQLADPKGYNYPYYPILFESEDMALKSKKILNDNWVYPRRYFYPSLTKLPYTNEQNELTVVRSIASKVLCMPLFNSLSIADIDFIARLLITIQNK